MSKELFYQNNFIQDNTFSNDYLEFSHIHIGNIKKNFILIQPLFYKQNFKVYF